MKESATYQAILREGEMMGIIKGQVREAQRMVLHAGLRRLGPPTREIELTVMAIASVTHLEMLHNRVFDVGTWDDLLLGL